MIRSTEHRQTESEATGVNTTTDRKQISRLARGALAVLAATAGLCVAVAPASAAPPIVKSESVAEVTATSANLEASLETGGEPGEFYFEYGPAENTYGSRVPAANASVSGVSAVASVAEALPGLASGETYYYRVVAIAGGSEVDGLQHAFTTQSKATGSGLIQGRSWELVSPTQKYGARLEAITNEGGVIEASENGSALTYVANTPPVEDPEGNPSLGDTQLLSTRALGGGWSTRDLAVPHAEANGVHVGYLAEYLAFSPNLTAGLVEPWGESALAPLTAPASEKSVYIRQDLLGGETLYTPLVDNADVEPGTHYGKETKRSKGNLRFVSATANLEHVVIESMVPLITPNPEAHPGIYEWSAGVLRPVSIEPGGEWVPFGEAKLGDEGRDVRNAISSDGQYVFFTARVADIPHLFGRDVIGETTTRIDAAQGITEPSELEMLNVEGPQFQDATPDGARVYFTDELRLTPSSTAEPGKPELYEYNFEKPAGEQLTDLTPSPAGPVSGTSSDVQGQVLGVTESGEYLYFVADGVLAEGASPGKCETSPEAGATCNLYVAHVGSGTVTTTLIAVLSAEDEHDWQSSAEHAGVFAVSSRMSPNGHYLAFMSDRSLTGYDNTDVVSGAADEEVYLYDATTERLACASCDPTGARPHGVEDVEESGEGLGLLVDRPQSWKGKWLAGNLPGWTSWAEGIAQYQSRYLSDEGRLFFDAADALVPQDSNGKEDVYEYEPEGLTGCGAGATGQSEVFKPSRSTAVEGSEHVEPGGCVGLISSGTSSRESAFLDASESGNDVFFLTASRLSPEDLDSSLDVYDAHVCAGAAPCAASAPAKTEACESSSSCEFGPLPPAGANDASPTEASSGLGNLLPTAAPSTGKTPAPAPLTRAQKLTKALKACAKKKAGKKRTVCKAAAERNYGAISAVKKPRHVKVGKK
jgi:hypothetical protein